MEHKMTFTLGDWSDDGHGKVEIFYLKSNLTPELVGTAYKKAVEMTGIKPHDDWACGYEERSFDANKLIEAGIPEGVVRGEQNEDGYFSDCEHYVNLIIAFCKLGNPNLEMEIMSPDTPTDLREHLAKEHGQSYGYGLFD
jgi:hypothetical protein